MNKRQFQRLSPDEQRAAVRAAAKQIDSLLNLFGDETVDDLTDAAIEGNGADERAVEDLLTPGPHFPRAFCEAARPACNRYLRYARYWRES